MLREERAILKGGRGALCHGDGAVSRYPFISAQEANHGVSRLSRAWAYRAQGSIRGGAGRPQRADVPIKDWLSGCAAFIR